MRVRVCRLAAIRSEARSRAGALSASSLFALGALLLAPSSALAQSPYHGAPATLPGGIQAEDFDHGGQGVGYYDDSGGNSGGSYRSTDVDVEPTSSGGYAVGWIRAGEWLRFSVNVTQSGNYYVNTRIASLGSGGTFHLEFNGQDRSGALQVYNTGGWRNYADLGTTVYLEAGVQAMRIVFDSNGSSGFVGNLSFLQFEYQGGGSPSSPPPSSGGGGGGGGSSAFGGSAWSLPGGLQAEDFDNGGNGVAYGDHTSGNSGGMYRSTDVDIAPTGSGGYTVGWIGAGEWLQYTVNVTQAGDYRVTARVASAGTGGRFHIESSNGQSSGAFQVPDTGGWTSFRDATGTIRLDAGVQRLRVVFDSNGAWNSVGNLSFMQFDLGGGGGGGSPAPAPSPAPPPSSGGGRIRVATWNIHFGHGNPWAQAQTIADSGADVVLLQEVSTFDEYSPSTYVERLRQITGRQWYSVWAPHGGMYTDNEGTMILSRLPLVDQSTMNSHHRGFSRAVVSVGGVHVTLVNAHLDWDTGLRSAQLEAFMSWGRQFGGPRIAGGDFNSWWGEWWIIRMLNEHTDTWVDATGSNEGGLTLNGAVRFDYLFRAHDQNWRLTPLAAWIHHTGASDHQMVVADFQVQ